ncbi:protein of unknown function [Sulfurivirga caldicuralii]|uniref:TMEM205-like domain-containing protein n=1 Tax=Sulfurivirga caldicuralii TaxID=364032 RepID=A0A1N6E3Q0_9GAMM|nr:DUF4149 domain-containing protein [Sulfurivirga caldicuralii]SIN77629.1 protein of unknown function [Sulfurivirga caldicuralii]
MNTSELRRRVAALSLWFSALVAQAVIGYVVAPVLFTQLDKKTAGHIAGILLNGVEISAVVLVVAGLLLWRQRVVAWLALAFVLLQGVQLLYLNPAMAALKHAGAAESQQFMMLHGVSHALYLAGILLLAGLVAMSWRSLAGSAAKA